ncbi:MAG: hydrogenase maturation protease [Cyanobium sp. CZS 25K]|nr:hydrogenase maturation protease [Cyanobium sp. CZS25K]
MNGRGEALLIGIGNPLRGDDGVGWHLVEGLGLQRHQLTPELAETVAAADRLLIVDAWLAPPHSGSLLRPLVAARGWERDSHRVDPARLLALAEQLFDRCVPAHELLVPAFDFSWGDRFSPALRRQLPEARRLLRGWLQGALPLHA